MRESRANTSMETDMGAILILLISLFLAGPAFAVDGILEIN